MHERCRPHPLRASRASDRCIGHGHLSGYATYQVSALIARQMGSHDDLWAAIYPKRGCVLALQTIVTISTRWHARNSFESLSFTSEIHASPCRRDTSNQVGFEHRLGRPRNI